MKIKVLADSYAINKNFSIGWGVAFLVGDELLFDTGETGDILLHNMEQMGVSSATNLKTVVISHDHWDHTGGLWALLKQNPQIKVYACPNFSLEFKEKVVSAEAELIEASRFTQIAEDIYTTGEIAGVYNDKYMAEEALVIKSPKGLIILTGCAHPGIITILEKVKENLSEDIYLVMGGFHLMGKNMQTIALIIDKFRELKVTVAAPTHCSGKETEALFKKEYQNDFIPVKTGMTIEV
ncbi:MAG: MBL fold metallo-hydrolase [bacterium]